MLNVYVKFQDNTTLYWEFDDGDVQEGGPDVFQLKQRIVIDEASPMEGRDVEKVRVIYQGNELKDGAKLVNGGTYYPILRLPSVQ